MRVVQNEIGKGSFQELDQVSAVSMYTKWRGAPNTVAAIPDALQQAIQVHFIPPPSLCGPLYCLGTVAVPQLLIRCCFNYDPDQSWMRYTGCAVNLQDASRHSDLLMVLSDDEFSRRPRSSVLRILTESVQL